MGRAGRHTVVVRAGQRRRADVAPTPSRRWVIDPSRPA